MVEQYTAALTAFHARPADAPAYLRAMLAAAPPPRLWGIHPHEDAIHFPLERHAGDPRHGSR